MSGQAACVRGRATDQAMMRTGNVT
jgi:hypothetical protein